MGRNWYHSNNQNKIKHIENKETKVCPMMFHLRLSLNISDYLYTIKFSLK